LKAFLLAAGLGTRLRPITDTVPKCMVEIKGKPLLGHWLDMISASDEIEQIFVNTHYLAEQVETFIAKSSYADNVNLIHEKELMGTAGTLYHHRERFLTCPLMLIHADNYSVFDMAAFIRSHRERPADCPITMMTFRTDTPKSCGIVRVNHCGVVTDFFEKVDNPPDNLANGAVYIIEPEVVNALDKGVFDFSTQVLPGYMNRIFTFENTTYHRDIGTPESYEKARAFL